MATAEKRVITDATGQAMLAELRKIPGVMNPLPVEKGGTGVTTPEAIRELINAQEKFDFNVEEQLNAAVKSVNELKPDANGNVQILRVPMADNFTSDESQVLSGAFIERTTGGDASIYDGNAYLGVLYGNSVRAGYTAESTNMELHLAGRLDDSEPMSAEINWDTYKTAVEYISTNKTFTYTTSWNENPETYGIIVSGTPISGDVINVYYIAENRGTITNATPTKLVETNWNLYDSTTGICRVLKYSDDYGFKIGGSYTSISFSNSKTSESKTVITPDSNGLFTIPEDGYLFVTGGNDTDTYILMTWSDWSDGYSGDFLTKNDSEIDFSELMSTTFPNGMCAVGITMDEINFNDKVAVVRIERMAYTTENRIIAENSGREFTYDDDYIYIVKETPERVRFNIDNDVVVYDHGTEYFTDTVVPPLAYMLFGQNLKDKLRREVVAVTPQSFSAAQKAQARNNIEAAWNSEVIKSINNKIPDANGNINIVEGQSNASYGSYRIDTVIPPAAWSLVNGQYQVAYFDPLVKSTMTGAETWLDDSDVMLGATHFNSFDGGITIITEVQPTETWRLHILLAENGATVLEQVNNKAEESSVAISESGDTAVHSIAVGQYVIWKGDIYKATSAIAVGDTITATGNGANIAAVTGGVGNDLNNIIENNVIHDVNYGTAQSPVTNLDNIRDDSSGIIILDASISPVSGSMVSGSYWKMANDSNNYSIIFHRQYSNDLFIYSKAGGSVKGWQQLALNSSVTSLLGNFSYFYRGMRTPDISASNIDSYINTGIYQAWIANNIPIVGNAWGILIVSAYGTTVIEQIIITNNGIVKRHWENNAWSSWAELTQNTKIANLIVGGIVTAASGFYAEESIIPSYVHISNGTRGIMQINGIIKVVKADGLTANTAYTIGSTPYASVKFASAKTYNIQGEVRIGEGSKDLIFTPTQNASQYATIGFSITYCTAS